MQLVNYQEEVVLAVISLVLEDHAEIDADETFVHDVAAYVLNRLPPRYIMSERGLTRMAAEQWLLDPEDEPAGSDGADAALTRMVELLILVNKGVEVVESRRGSAGAQPRRRGKLPPESVVLESGYWHNFPQFIGRLVDARQKTPIIGATVTMSAGRLGAIRSERGWSNPSTTKDGTKGYFSLWPHAIQAPAERKTLYLRLTFEHPHYQTVTRDYRYRSRGELIFTGQLRLDRVINLGTQLLRPMRVAGRTARR